VEILNNEGTVTVLEIARLVFENYFALSHPIEFHFYSAEEGGLKGSQAVSEVYLAERRPVVGMLQLDMTGYYDELIGRKMAVGLDNTDPELRALLGLVMDEYTDKATGRIETSCGYACSGLMPMSSCAQLDHSSWIRAGYRSAFASETDIKASNPNIHTSRDDVDLLDFTYIAEFVKVGVGLAVELGGKVQVN
jgi:bacterial leucyl aminopeptidase